MAGGFYGVGYGTECGRRIFNFQKAYAILDELIIAGELQESSKKSVLRVVTQADTVEEQENSEDTLARLGSRLGEWGGAVR